MKGIRTSGEVHYGAWCRASLPKPMSSGAGVHRDDTGVHRDPKKEPGKLPRLRHRVKRSGEW